MPCWFRSPHMIHVSLVSDNVALHLVTCLLHILCHLTLAIATSISPDQSITTLIHHRWLNTHYNLLHVVDLKSYAVANAFYYVFLYSFHLYRLWLFSWHQSCWLTFSTTTFFCFFVAISFLHDVFLCNSSTASPVMDNIVHTMTEI